MDRESKSDINHEELEEHKDLSSKTFKGRIFFCYFDQSCNTRHWHLNARLPLQTLIRLKTSAYG